MASDWALLGETGVKSAVVTLDGKGAVVLVELQTWPIQPVHIDPTPVVPVDTTGCGDAFTGALAAAELANGSDLAAAADFASKAAAYAATGGGRRPPTRPDRS